MSKGLPRTNGHARRRLLSPIRERKRINSKGGWYDGLDGRESKFVDEFLVDFNAEAAARRAGFSEEKAAQAVKMMTNDYIQNALTKAGAEWKAKHGITDELIETIARENRGEPTGPPN